jgi:aryl-alcohol dehydrogenase-like predicted oxidoreductase
MHHRTLGKTGFQVSEIGYGTWGIGKAGWTGAGDEQSLRGLNAVRRLKEQGKIRFFGVSINDHQPDSALGLVESGVVDTVQVIYNIFDQSPEDRLLPACRQHSVGVIVRVPLDEGGLSGKVTPDTVFAAGDFQARYFPGPRR